MNHTSQLPVESERKALVISFGERFFSSDRFDAAFDAGMSLVEEAATYLDGPGRQEAKRLSADASFVYATESMRLTTRLMQIASWLLIRRSVSEGEMTAGRAREEEKRLKLIDEGLDDLDEEALLLLPIKLQDIVMRSHSFHKQVLSLHKMLEDAEQGELSGRENKMTSPLEQNLTLLNTAFGS